MTDYQMDSIAYSLACRICLQDNLTELSSIFAPDESNPSISLYQKIEECAGIKIINKPELPSNICNKCNAFLTIAYKFRKICRNSDNYLRKFVCKPPTIEDALPGEFDESITTGVEMLENDMTLDNYENDGEAEVEFLMDSTAESTPNLMQLNAVNSHSYTGSQDSISTLAIETYDQEEFVALTEANDENNCIAYEDGGQDDNSQDYVLPFERDYAPVKTIGILSDGAAVIQIKNNRPPKQSPMYICSVCGNTYPRKISLDAHMRRHRTERRFE